MTAADLLDIMESKAPSVPVYPNQDREGAIWHSSRAQWVQELRAAYNIYSDSEPESAGVYADVLQQQAND